MKQVQIIFVQELANKAHAAIAPLLPQLFVVWEQVYACSITYDAGVPYYSNLIEDFIIDNDELIDDYRFTEPDNDLVEIFSNNTKTH